MWKGDVKKMMHTEYVRSLNCNYERILLDKKPEEKRYQYCILNRGGIRGLLSCSLRYINGLAYLYYDISSMQNVSQLYGNHCITRKWMVDFLWSMRQVKQALERFLLDSKNIIWYPEQIFQDLENNVFSFLYLPYYEGESGFLQLMEFLVEHIDYEDETLVNCVYHMYEQLERNGEVYLEAQIYEDAKCLEETKLPENTFEMKSTEKPDAEPEMGEPTREVQADGEKTAMDRLMKEKAEKRGIFGLFEGRKKRSREQREDYRQIMHQAMAGYAVAEETDYEKETDYKKEADYEEETLGRTVFIEEKAVKEKCFHRLLTAEGKLLAMLDKPVLSIGKKKGEVDVVLENVSVSRIHARILVEREDTYLEDLNSTNGTYKNGLRMQPYEKRRLEEGDEIKCGAVELIFR